MAKKDYTSDITEKLVGFEEEIEFEPATVPEIKTPDRPASEVLKAFMDANGITLAVSPPNENIKTVSDGSIILQAPKILVSYK